jgi:D-alanine-D-alanine ligase
MTIGVFFGSRSAEHDVSIVTAIGAVIKPLEASKKFTVVPVYITKQGIWYSDEKLKDIGLYSSGKIDEVLRTLKPVALQFDGGLTLIKPGIKNQKISIDIAFPATHGTYGEDGSLMGIFRMANIPFVGCDMAASAIAMDKVYSKLLAQVHGVPITAMRYFTKHAYAEEAAEIVDGIQKNLRYPLFVKPAHLGSSIGISRVTDAKDLENAIEVALHYDDKVLVEEGVNNLIEVTVPIMGNQVLQPAYVEQPVRIQDDGFFDFDKKYINEGGKKGGAKGGKSGAQGYSKIPAEIPKHLYESSEVIAMNVYEALGCEGLARVDLLIDSVSNEIFFNEVNPLPGQLYNHNWRQKGVSPSALVERLIELAQERFEHQKELNTVFTTNFLKQF